MYQLTLYQLYQRASGNMPSSQLNQLFGWSSATPASLGQPVWKSLNQFVVMRGNQGLHLSAAFLVQAVLKSDYQSSKITTNYLKGVKFIQENILVRDALKMYKTNVPAIQSDNLFAISEKFQGVSVSQLTTMHTMNTTEVNQATITTLKNLQDIGLSVEGNTMQTLFKLAFRYGNY